MADWTIRSGVDAEVRFGHPNRHYGGGNKLRARNDDIRSYIRFHVGTYLRAYDSGETIQSAFLTLTPAPGWAAATDALTELTVRRVERWSSSKVTWNNHPGPASGSTGVSAVLVNGRWRFDVTADVVAWHSGEPNYGWHVTGANASDAGIYFYGFATDRDRDRPSLALNISLEPSKPVNLRPSAAAASVPRPRLTWVTDSMPASTSTTDDIDSFQVQVDPAANATSPAFDSGWVVSERSIYNLAESSYPALTAGASTSWRVRVRNAFGTSRWSEWATFSYEPLPTLTITNPPSLTNDPTPLIAWTFPNQTQRRIIVTNPAENDLLYYDTGWQATTETQHEPESSRYAVDALWTGEGSLDIEVRGRDGVVREATPGAKSYAFARKSVFFAYSASVPPVAYLTVYQLDPYPVPVPVLTWARTDAPDGGWMILRDDFIIARVTDPFEVQTDVAGVYSWTDWTAASWRDYRYEVRPVVDGAAAEGGDPADFRGTYAGTCLLDPETLAHVELGDARFSLAYGETTTVHTPVEAARAVKINHGLRGLEGSVEGVILEDNGRTWQEQEADLFSMKEATSKTYRLIFGDMNIPVLIYNVTPILSEETLPNAWRQTVRFDVLQQGELPWRR